MPAVEGAETVFAKVASVSGDGWAVGTMLTPAAGRLVLGRSVATITDTHLDLGEGGALFEFRSKANSLGFKVIKDLVAGREVTYNEKTFTMPWIDQEFSSSTAA